MLYQSFKLIATFALLLSFASTSLANEKECKQIDQHFQERMEELLDNEHYNFAKELVLEYQAFISPFSSETLYKESVSLTHVRLSVGFPNIKAVPAPCIIEQDKSLEVYKSDIIQELKKLDRRLYTIAVRHDPNLASISIEIYLKLDKHEEKSLKILKAQLPKKKRKKSSAFDYYDISK